MPLTGEGVLTFKSSFEFIISKSLHKIFNIFNLFIFKWAENKEPRENMCFLLPFVTTDLLLPGPFLVKTKTSLLSHYRMSSYRLYLLNASLDVFSFFCSFRIKKRLFKGFRNLLVFQN